MIEGGCGEVGRALDESVNSVGRGNAKGAKSGKNDDNRRAVSGTGVQVGSLLEEI